MPTTRSLSALRLAAVCLVLVSGFASSASALSVVFQWEAVLLDSGGAVGIPGVNNGDPVVIRIFADNGGSDLNDQIWNNEDIIRGELTAGATGAYTATYFPPTSFGDPVFQTDAAGQVSLARQVFAGPLNPANFDSLGGTALPSQARNLAMGSDPVSVLSWNFPTSDTFDASQWTVAVPEPSTLPLVSLGLLVLGRRRYGRSGPVAAS